MHKQILKEIGNDLDKLKRLDMKSYHKIERSLGKIRSRARIKIRRMS